jgi:DNA-binding transcriptional LysR family regulator
MNATLRQIEAFVRVYRLGSLTRAAGEMHLTPSAVSVLVRQLEHTWQARLFDRTTRALRPTEAAVEAVPVAERVLGELQRLGSEMRDLSKLRRGRVTFAATASVASSLMPAIVKRFVAAHPEIDVVIQDVAPDQLVSRVRDGHAELGIGTVNAPGDELRLDKLCTDRMSAICVRGSGLARRRRITWAELRDHPTISVRRGGDIRMLIDAALARARRRFEPTYEVSLLTTSLAMTAHGLGASILPPYLVPHLGYPSLVAVPLVSPVVHRTLSIVTLRERSLSPAGRRFVEMAKAVVG